jgi:hypothetical protein
MNDHTGTISPGGGTQGEERAKSVVICTVKSQLVCREYNCIVNTCTVKSV